MNFQHNITKVTNTKKIKLTLAFNILGFEAKYETGDKENFFCKKTVRKRAIFSFKINTSD